MSGGFIMFLIIVIIVVAVVGAINSDEVQGQMPQEGPDSTKGGQLGKRYQYKPQHAEKPFAFDLVKQQDGEVRIYISDGPSYGSRPTDGHSTHRFTDENHRHYVCIREDLRPTNYEHARDWARYWADRTALYIRTGKPFS